MLTSSDRADATEALARAGFLAPAAEADALARCAADAEDLRALVARRCTGEPLAWITGSVTFAGLEVRVAPGVYVPRPQTELVAARAIEHLPPGGRAGDVCCGSGAIARALQAARPGARVVALDLDERAVACARANGVDARRSDLLDELPPELIGRLDVVVASVPYVPTAHLPLLPRDTLAFEDATAYDGGADGLDLLRRLAAQARAALAPGGCLVVELGVDQVGTGADVLRSAGLDVAPPILDDEGDARGLVATRRS